MNSAEKRQEKIKILQKRLADCDNDFLAISLQKELIDLLCNTFEDKEFLTDLVSKQKE